MKETPDIKPPKWADRFFEWYCRNELTESIQGDLHERYEAYLSSLSKRKADSLYWRDVLLFMNRHTLRRTYTRQLKTNWITMFNNYTLVAFRNILRNKAFTGINVLGLSVSMSICLVIITMINDQTSYDDFHKNGDQIYRVTHRRSTGVDLAIATVPAPLGKKIREEFPGVEDVVRFRRGVSGEILDNGKAIAINGLFTDTEFFDLFQFELRSGDRSTALDDPFSIILKRDIAEKFFKTQDPMGQTLLIEGLGQFKVTGVLEEFPGKSHLEFQALASFSTVPLLENQGKLSDLSNSWDKASASWLYFKAEQKESLRDLQVYLDELTDEFYNEESEFTATFFLQKMTDITPGPLMGNQIGQSMPNFFVYGLIVLAFLIMICATLNYANLSTARAITRLKEVGIRKVMGSTRPQLIFQFVLEAVLISLIALAVAILLLNVMLIPAFEQLSISSILGWELVPDLNIYLQFVLFSMLTGIFTGFFPSLYMASVQAIQALKGARIPKMSRVGLKKSLILVQLVISVILIISSSLVHRQIKYMITRDYGFEKDNILNIDLQGQDFQLLKTELEQVSFVDKVSGANNIPSIGRHDDIKVRRFVSDEQLEFNYFSVDENYVDNLDLQLLAGSNFNPSISGSHRQLMINEQALKTLGFEDPSEAVGVNLILEDSTSSKIIGVVKDYNFMMLYMDIKPLILQHHPEEFEWAQVKLASNPSINQITQLEHIWSKLDPNHDLEFEFFDEQIEDFYSTFYDIVYIVGLVSILSMVIAGMGLLAIATYTVRIRLKEVGIRKVLGARPGDIVILLGKGFFVLILVGTLIGSSLSFLGNKAWLDLFAYRIDFGLDIMGIAFLFVLTVTVLTIGIQALKAVETNPSEILRNE